MYQTEKEKERSRQFHRVAILCMAGILICTLLMAYAFANVIHDIGVQYHNHGLADSPAQPALSIAAAISIDYLILSDIFTFTGVWGSLASAGFP